MDVSATCTVHRGLKETHLKGRGLDLGRFLASRRTPNSRQKSPVPGSFTRQLHTDATAKNTRLIISGHSEFVSSAQDRTNRRPSQEILLGSLAGEIVPRNRKLRLRRLGPVGFDRTL